MKELFKALWRGFKSIRLPLVAFVISTILFLVLLFPLNDLGDLITSKVSLATAGKVYFQFDDLSLSIMPPGLQMNQVFIETSQFSGLKANELTLRPSISGMLKGKPYGFVNAQGLLKGEVTVNLTSGTPTEKGVERAQLELTAQKINLKELRSLLGLPFFIQGDLKLETSALADLSFQEQPEMELNFMISKFELPPTNVETAFGPVTLPEMKLKEVTLKARMVNGSLVVEKGEVGKPGDEIQATLKGTIAVSLKNLGGQIVPVLGSYNFDVDLKTQKSFMDKAGLFLSFLQSHQKSPGQYKFKVASPQWGLPPNVTTLR